MHLAMALTLVPAPKQEAVQPLVGQLSPPAHETSSIFNLGVGGSGFFLVEALSGGVHAIPCKPLLQVQILLTHALMHPQAEESITTS